MKQRLGDAHRQVRRARLAPRGPQRRERQHHPPHRAGQAHQRPEVPDHVERLDPSKAPRALLRRREFRRLAPPRAGLRRAFHRGLDDHARHARVGLHHRAKRREVPFLRQPSQLRHALRGHDRPRPQIQHRPHNHAHRHQRPRQQHDREQVERLAKQRPQARLEPPRRSPGRHTRRRHHRPRREPSNHRHEAMVSGTHPRHRPRGSGETGGVAPRPMGRPPIPRVGHTPPSLKPALYPPER